MNKLSRLRLLVVLGSSSFAYALALQACSSDDSNTNDAGNDATQSNDAPLDTGSNDANGNDAGTDASLGCPTYSGSSTICKAIIAHCQACGATISACDFANFTTECESLSGIYSQPYASAVTACATQCDKDAATACEKQDLADASLSAAQTKVATDYCAKCGDGGACVPFVETELNLIDYSDTLATAIDNACTPDASSACAGYGSCFFGTLVGSLPKSPCADAGAD